VREAVFSSLGEIDGAVVLDLFAGSGALGIEALSRGAERAVFVERSAVARRALQSNLVDLKLTAPAAEVRGGDALSALRAARSRAETYDLVFIDPPYQDASELAGGLSAALVPLLNADARVVVESDRRAPLELPALVTGRQRRYGDTLITIHHLP
jgi:16S rRNA (guanine966-N2)-methyltransferase